MKKVGYWMTEKKRKKLNFDHFGNLCRATGFELVQIDLMIPLADQGPFAVIIHKLTDVLTQAQLGDKIAQTMIANLQTYVREYPSVVVVDPIEAVLQLMNRNISYTVIQSLEPNSDFNGKVRVPSFVEIKTRDTNEIQTLLKQECVTFPIVCKHSQAHGSVNSHKMAIIFNEDGLTDVTPPCVAQTFINHNALLHKIFVVGEEYFLVERPSVKNFAAGDRSTIFFDSHDVSKPDSASFLNELDERDQNEAGLQPCTETLSNMVQVLRRTLNMSLFGVDVIVENRTGIHYIIDINAFPGYDGMEFLTALHSHVYKILQDPTKYQSIPAEKDDTPSNKDVEEDRYIHSHTSTDNRENDDSDSEEEKKRLEKELLSVSSDLIVPPTSASKEISSHTSCLDVNVTLEKM